MESLAQWVGLHLNKYPALNYLYHTPNGGYRHPVTAARLKRQLVKKGIPDLFLPFPVGVYPGLWIELKAAKGKPTTEQRDWIDAMQSLGYAAKVCYGWEEASITLSAYLNGEY